jgi:hypothetical protein
MGQAACCYTTQAHFRIVFLLLLLLLLLRLLPSCSQQAH